MVADGISQLMMGFSMNLLNAGCGTHYAQGWTNTDVWSSDTTKPDIVVKPGEPYPFDDNTFDAVFMGHVIEHIPWNDVPRFLNDISRVAKPNAPMLIVGPDVFKTIKRWHEGQEPWWMIESVMEHLDMNFQPDRETEWWDGAHHHWNCHEKRVEKLLHTLGYLNIENVYDLIPNDPNGKSWSDEVTGITWPVVGKYFWQLAFRFTNCKE
jgi:predicted SAM-dependent methyltransferase